jgi:3-dehydroquinate synthase
MSASTVITVRGNVPYDVVVGRGLLGELPALLGAQVQRAAVIHPRAMRGLASTIEQVLTAQGVSTLLIEVPEAEGAKTADVLSDCWTKLGRAGFTRSDVVLGVGGGATTDLAGFVAATWLRGVRLINVPTTLLGMVDAAVGGKTGINTAEGKNLVGSFHAPTGVLCDLDTLNTLPRKDFASGMAEVVKCGFIADPHILDLVESDVDGAVTPGGALVRQLVERAIQVKADVVAGDLRESLPGGLGREILNYGHTFGHAVEQVEHYSWRHGDAVSVGMIYVAELAGLAGRLDVNTLARHYSVLESLNLPTSYRGDHWPALFAAMKMDKKSRGDRLRFVVLDDLAKPGLLDGPDEALLQAAYARVSA